MTKALFPGSFDPFTLGHADVVERALSLFDEVIVAVGYNEHKQGWIPVEERIAAIRQLYQNEPRVQVLGYTSLTADFAQQLAVTCILRGVRSVKDYEYEQQMADVNRQLTGIDTVLLMADPRWSSLSSTVVRELAHFGHDIQRFLPRRSGECDTSPRPSQHVASADASRHDGQSHT